MGTYTAVDEIALQRRLLGVGSGSITVVIVPHQSDQYWSSKKDSRLQGSDRPTLMQKIVGISHSSLVCGTILARKFKGLLGGLSRGEAASLHTLPTYTHEPVQSMA
jgi:hypothetical protein